MIMNNIPGYLTAGDCELLHKFASGLNRKECTIIELGSLHGKSSSILAKAAPLASVFCIDPWYGNDSSVKGISEEKAKKLGWPVHGTRNTYEFFKENTKDCPNIIAMKTASPAGLQDLGLFDCDMVFLDAAHRNPSDRENIDFWLPRVKKGGIFAGHDYDDERFPDIVANVKYMSERLGKEVILTPGSLIWYFYV